MKVWSTEDIHSAHHKLILSPNNWTYVGIFCTNEAALNSLQYDRLVEERDYDIESKWVRSIFTFVQRTEIPPLLIITGILKHIGDI